MKNFSTQVKIAVVGILLLSMISSALSYENEIADSKIQPELASYLHGTAQVPVIITLRGQPQISSNNIASVKSQVEKQQQDAVSYLASRAINVKSLWLTNAIAAEVPSAEIASLALRSDVARIEYDAPVHIDAQDAAAVNAWGVDKINAPAVWVQGIRGEGIVVAVIDTGVDASHADLDDLDDNHATNDPKVVLWKDYINGLAVPYDDNGHGTHVSGTISGTGAGGVNTGVAPQTKLIQAKIFNETGWGNTSDIIAAFGWAVSNGADIISYSGVGPHTNSWTTAINNVVAAGVVPVIAAGNEGPSPGTISCPGDEKNSIAVGATDSNDVIALFSSRGPVTLNAETYIKPDVSAPGVAVISTLPGGGYGAMNGASMATPHASGTAALMLQKEPGLTPAQVKQRLESTAVDLGTVGKDNDYGAGRIDAYKAVFAPQPPDISVYPPYIDVTLPSNQETARILNISNVGSADLTYTIKDVEMLFSDDMEKGVNNWKADGLWHQSKHRYQSPATAWYYGIENVWNYDTGAPNKGNLTSPLIDLTGVKNAALTFWRWEQTEGGEYWDHRHVYISADNGATWNNIYVSKGTDQGMWIKENIDISSYAGKKVLIRFEFDTVDADLNNYEGWYVDDVAVTGEGAADWLSESPTAGTVSPNRTHLINVKINSTGLAPAAYNADIIIASNDPDEAVINVPVNLQVTGPVGTIVSIQDAAAAPGANVTVPIKITNVTNLGAADIWLSYDKNVVIVESIADGDLGALAAANIDNANGIAKMNWFSATGKTGNFVFAYVTLKAVGAAGQTGVLDLTVKELVDANGVPIAHGVDDGKFAIAYLMEGDTNLSNHVTITDALLIAKYKAGLIVLTPDQLKAADTSDDGSVTVTDALFIAKWLADPTFPLWDAVKDSDMLQPVP